MLIIERNLTGFPDCVLAVRCGGHVMRKDYEDVLIPAARQALQDHAKVGVYYSVDDKRVLEQVQNDLAVAGHWATGVGVRITSLVISQH